MKLFERLKNKLNWKKTLHFLKRLTVMTLICVPLGFGLNLLNREYLVYKDLKIRQNIKNSSVMVLLPRGGSGSGIAIRSDTNGTFIVTNKHVCSTASYKSLKQKSSFNTTTYVPLTVKPMGDAEKTQPLFYTAQVMEVAQNYDLCLLYIDEPDFATTPIGKNPPVIGDKLYSYSNPFGFPGIFSEGEVNFSVYVDNSLYQMTTVYAQMGSSGSGVFNTNGELIGIVTLVDSMFTYITPLAHIIHFTGNIANK